MLKKSNDYIHIEAEGEERGVFGTQHITGLGSNHVGVNLTFILQDHTRRAVHLSVQQATELAEALLYLVSTERQVGRTMEVREAGREMREMFDQMAGRVPDNDRLERKIRKVRRG